MAKAEKTKRPAVNLYDKYKKTVQSSVYVKNNDLRKSKEQKYVGKQKSTYGTKTSRAPGTLGGHNPNKQTLINEIFASGKPNGSAANGGGHNSHKVLHPPDCKQQPNNNYMKLKNL